MNAMQFNDLVLTLEAAEQTAHRGGLHATAHAINEAKNRAGWERAEQLDRAADQPDVVPRAEYDRLQALCTAQGIRLMEAEDRTPDDLRAERDYFVPCTHCGEFQRLAWANVRWWPGGRPGDAAYVCQHCGMELGDADQAEMLRQGEWRATLPQP